MPTARELSYAYQKLERAKHHILDLNGRSEAFLAERPFKLMTHYRPKACEVAFRIKTEKSIPPEFSLIIGDAVHNLRAALDFVLYALAKDRAPSPGYIAFPFPRKDGPDALEGAINSGQVKFAGEKVSEEVRRLDPRQTRNSDLYGLHMLDIRDKHQLIILNRCIPEFTAEDLTALFTKHNDRVSFRNLRLRHFGPDNEDIFVLDRFKFFVRNRPDSQKEADVQPAFTITFGEGSPFAEDPVIEVLVRLQKVVRSAVNSIITAYLDPGNTFPR